MTYSPPSAELVGATGSCRECKKPARYVVRDHHGYMIGRFCEWHGQAQLRKAFHWYAKLKALTELRAEARRKAD